MSRKARLASDSGIYHVMLRGVNRQDIFECDKDYIKFLNLIRREAFPVDETGKALPSHLVVYAYCLMPNHVHLLVKEQSGGISAPIQSIAIAYAYYFNHKYEHIGHMFQDRFRSEVVNDMEYFVTLLRYIHQNPVAGGLVRNVRDYPWSSWYEYDPKLCCEIPVCCADVVLKRISFEALEELVNEPLPKAQRILDFDRDTGTRIDDDLVREYIHEALGISDVATIQHLDKERRNEVLKRLLEFCGNLLQVSRVTGISRGVIQRALGASN